MRFAVLSSVPVLAAIMDLSDQELCIALKEFKRTMVDVSDLFLSLLENRFLNLE